MTRPPVRPPEPGDALVLPAAVAPLRNEPTHRSELVSQLVLGETFTVEAVEGVWLRGHAPDGYVGWSPAAPFRHAAFTGEEWDGAATLRSLGVSVTGDAGAAGAHADSGPLRRLPWGARLRPGSVRPGPSGAVVLPDGRMVTPSRPERVVPRPDGAGGDGFPAAPDTRVRTVLRYAADWIGVPYLWGGRTDLGVDCSGFVQALFAMVGIALPRDSHQQFDAGPDLGVPDAADPPDAGDLLFFAPEGPSVTHVALSLGGRRIVHAASSNGAVREDDLDSNDPLGALLSGSITGHTRPARR